MSTTRQIAKGAIWNWASMAVTASVSFFLAPFVVRHLGNSAYGTWILINSIVEYLFLLDFGMRGTITKFISSGNAQQNYVLANRALSAALWFRLWLGLLIIGISTVMAVFLPRWFQLPPGLVSAAKWAMCFNGFTVAAALTFGIFGGVLAGVQRFDLLSVLGMLQAVGNAGGMVILLRSGRGIAALAAFQTFFALFIGLCTAVLAWRSWSHLALDLKWPDLHILRQVWAYGGYLFIIAISGQIIYYTDNIVIGAFLPVGAVAFYAIGAALTSYLRSILAALATTFLPVASELHARGEMRQLQRLLIHGTRSVLLVALPIEIGFLLRGPTFIRLWQGPQYQFTSGHVLQALTIAWVFIAGNYCSGNIVYGIAKHAPVAAWAFLEAVFNLSLSIVLVRRIGILGVAWGTVIPSLIVNLLLWPRYITHVLGIGYRTYLVQAWVRPMLALAPFAVACYFAERYWTVTSLGVFLLQMITILPLAGIGVGLSFMKEIRTGLQSKRRGMAALSAS